MRYEIAKAIAEGADIMMTAQSLGLSPATLRSYGSLYKRGLIRSPQERTPRSGRRAQAHAMFQEGASVEAVCKALGLLPKTARGYRWEVLANVDPLLR